VAQAAGQSKPGLRIVLAENNSTNCLVALRMIERLGHQADAVRTGVEVIAALSLTRYDLILMDVMVPKMDGLTTTREIRATERAEAVDRTLQPDVDPFLGERATHERCPDEIHRIAQTDAQQPFLQ
jgi:CheY-like chemotaxis protein